MQSLKLNFAPPPHPSNFPVTNTNKKTPPLLRASSGLYHLDGRVYNGHLVPPTAKKADAFSNYFVEKIETLKKVINKDLVKDPLTKLKKKMKKNVHVLNPE